MSFFLLLLSSSLDDDDGGWESVSEDDESVDERDDTRGNAACRCVIGVNAETWWLNACQQTKTDSSVNHIVVVVVVVVLMVDCSPQHDAAISVKEMWCRLFDFRFRGRTSVTFVLRPSMLGCVHGSLGHTYIDRQTYKQDALASAGT